MRKGIRLVLAAALALIFLVSGGAVVLRLWDYQGGAEDYGEAERLVELPTLPGSVGPACAESGPVEVPLFSEAPEEQEARFRAAMRDLDLAPLRGENSDVVGWIVIPNTQISYPLVQGTDNQYYLNHTWKKVRRAVGAIFLECRSSADFSDFNTIIYGHRMSDNSMFHTLLFYAEQDFWREHPTVYIAGDGECRRYEIFAAYEASVTGDTYRLKFDGEEERQAFVDYCLEHSVIATDIVPDEDGHILTLSTCTDEGRSATRWVVHAVLMEE